MLDSLVFSSWCSFCFYRFVKDEKNKSFVFSCFDSKTSISYIFKFSLFLFLDSLFSYLTCIIFPLSQWLSVFEDLMTRPRVNYTNQLVTARPSLNPIFTTSAPYVPNTAKFHPDLLKDFFPREENRQAFYPLASLLLISKNFFVGIFGFFAFLTLATFTFACLELQTILFLLGFFK